MMTSILRFPTIVIGFWMLIAAVSRAQEVKSQLLLGDSTIAPKESMERLFLRPNGGDRPVYVFATNPTPKAKEVSVAVLINGAEVPTLTATVSVPRGGTRVMFNKVEPTAAVTTDPGAKTAAPDPYAGWQELKNPTDKVEVRLFDKDTGKEADRVTISPEVMTPAQYLEVTKAVFTPAKENGEINYLTMRVKAGRDFTGPECKVQLVLSPERIPRLKTGFAPGSIDRGTLTKAGEEVELVIKDIQFNDALSGDGEVCLNVDSWQRAFVYQASFRAAGGQVNLVPIERTMVRVASKRYASPGQLTFAIECDNPPPKPEPRTEVMFRPLPTKQLPGAKDQRIRFNGAKDGGLTFNASVQDWQVRFDDVPEGDYQVQARVGTVESPPETVIVADGTKFGDLQLEVAPMPIRGKKFKVTAKCPPSRLPIKSVKFFVGRNEGDKIPADVVEGTPQDAERTTWAAELQVMDERKAAPVSAQFINVLGKHAFKTATVEFADPPQAPNTGSIKGKVVISNGDPQPDTEVTLISDKKEKKGEKTTNDKGEFEFADLEPGSYQIEANRKRTESSGKGSAKVEKGKVTDVKITIKRFGAK